MNTVLQHAGVQGYLVCKSAFVVFFIVKAKGHWDSPDRKERRINIRNFLHKRRNDRDLGWPLFAPVWKQRVGKRRSGKMAGCQEGL